MDKKILKIYQLTDGYCYNSDSLFLYDFATSFLKDFDCVLEIGSGSGVIGLLCGKNYQIDLTMIEIDPFMTYLCDINAKCNKIQSRIFCEDFFKMNFENKFDVIITNPPFYRSEIINAKNERIKIARNESYMPFEKLCNHVKKILKPKGNFIFCYDAKESHRVFFTLKQAGFNAEIIRFVYPRVDKEASLLLCKARINTKSSLKILPPLFTHKSLIQTDNTQEVLEIYAKTNTYSIKVDSTSIEGIL